jgi:hypothetical protein
MQAADFEIMLRKKLPLIFKNGQREIEGEVNLENEEIYPPSLSGIVFHGEVDLTGALVHGDLDFSNCTFVKRLDLCGITVSGTLFLNDAEVFGDGRLGDQPYIAVDATRAVINGDFEARTFVVAGSVSGNGAKFNGSIDLRGHT